MEDIGEVYVKMNEKSKCLSYFFQALLMRKEVYGEDGIEVALAYERIGDHQLDFFDGVSALDSYKQALEIYQKNENKHYFAAIRLLEHVGKLTIMEAENDIFDPVKAEQVFNKGVEFLYNCVQLQEKYLHNNTEEEVQWKRAILNYIAIVLYEKQRFDESESFLKKLLKF